MTDKAPTVDPEMVEWLCGVMNYPYDFSVKPPVPVAWRSAIEDYWIADDGTDDPQIQDAIRDTVAEEGRWDNGSSADQNDRSNRPD